MKTSAATAALGPAAPTRSLDATAVASFTGPRDRARSSDARARQRHLVRALARHVRSDTATGVRLALADYALFLLGLALAAFATHPALRIAGALLAGLKLCGFSVLGHDAAHNMLTRSRPLNKLIAVAVFTPCLFNYRLWLHAHHALHHTWTNGAPPDIHKPFTLQQYRALPAWRRLCVRASRSPSLIAQSLYFIYDRLTRVTIFSRVYPAVVRRQAVPFTLLTLAYLGGTAALLAWRRHFEWAETLIDVFLVMVLPLLVFHALTSIVLFLQHTHPRIPWFAPDDPVEQAYGQEELVAHVPLPRWLGNLMHYSLEHPVHHIVPTIPCYHAREAQAELNLLIGPRAVVLKPTLGNIRSVFRRCKLYDYETHRWRDFDGRYTSGSLARSVREPITTPRRPA
ncbi:fatty acid desaturase [Rhizobacter sp. J219]|uniref:fatty acid desaturase n=1 Tax=Rhizobacter sp. J219 TaxID=2898430 RepID=UPI002150B3F7|nr:fatty acid desaturase [Rhizobacter sp. J219]MCR5885634.1 fatty acid desaturase [Rhizobacter sp. J219]